MLLLGWNLASLLTSLAEIASAGGSGVARFGIPVTDGAFGHASYCSAAAASLIIFALVDRLSSRRLLPAQAWPFAIAVGGAVLVLSTRAKPLVAIVAALVFVLLSRRVRVGALPLAVGVGVGLVLMLPALSYVDVLSQERSGAAAFSQESHADTRITLVRGSLALAREDFPVGHGLGTFGSRLDSDLEFESLFDAGIVGHGLGRGDVNFISDSLLAHVIAERGFVGFSLWVLGLVFAVLLGILAGRGSLVFAASLAAVIVLAGVSPSFHSPPDAFLLLLPAAFVLGAVLAERRDPRPDEAV